MGLEQVATLCTIVNDKGHNNELKIWATFLLFFVGKSENSVDSVNCGILIAWLL